MIARTKLSFNDLDEATKTKLRDEHRDINVHYDWWGFVYEDAIACAKCLGIETNTKQIAFSGFWSQGDGASFTGSYTYKSDALLAIRAYAPQDAELHRIADTLTLLNITCVLTYGAGLTTKIVRRAHYYAHSHTMVTDEIRLAADDEYIGDNDCERYDNELQQLMRDFADWIYKRLEEEYNHLTSDETIDEWLKEQEFDEDGEMI